MISNTSQLDLFFFFFVNFRSAFVRSDWNVEFCHNYSNVIKLVDRKLGYQRLSNLLFSVHQLEIIDYFDTG